MAESRLVDQATQVFNAESLSGLAQFLLKEWQQAHGTPHGAASALAGPDSFAIHLEDAFSKAELNLATQPAGQNLIFNYTEGLLDQVCHNLIARVEDATGHKVISTGFSFNLKAGWIICFYKLGPKPLPGQERIAPC
jgi:hypothetical protein